MNADEAKRLAVDLCLKYSHACRAPRSIPRSSHNCMISQAISKLILQTDALAREEQREKDAQLLERMSPYFDKSPTASYQICVNDGAKAIRDSNKGGKA